MVAGKTVDAVYLAFGKAFDTISHIAGEIGCLWLRWAYISLDKNLDFLYLKAM